MARNQNGALLRRNVRQDKNGTWSANVWFGCDPATEIRRYYGYHSREAAREADISEIPEGGRIGAYSAAKLPE